MLTLMELKKIVKKADEKERIPSVKRLMEKGGQVVVKERLDEQTEVSVYESGYVLYRNGIYATVFPLHACGEYVYSSEVDEGYRYLVNILEKENWYIRLMLEGEDHLVHNQDNRVAIRMVSYSAVLPLMTNNQRDIMIELYIEKSDQTEVPQWLDISQQAASDMVRKDRKRVKKAIVENVTALVDEYEIHIDDVSIAIEEGNYLVRKFLHGTCEYYQTIDGGFFKGYGSTFPDNYHSKVTKGNKSVMEKSIQSNDIMKASKKIKKQHKIFISHSSKDREYVLAIVELLEDLGLQDGSIVCSSVPGHGIPGGERTFDWLRKQFIDCDLRVIFVLSKNYYASTASLNEMGAAWVTKASDTLLLLPGFKFEDIKGCIDPTEIGIKLDGDDAELKHRLGELKDTLVLEHNLNSYSGPRWERHRDDFIKSVNKLNIQNSEAMSLESE